MYDEILNAESLINNLIGIDNTDFRTAHMMRPMEIGIFICYLPLDKVGK